MTAKDLLDILEKHAIPDNARVISDRGYECCATDVDHVFYNPDTNVAVLTQDIYDSSYDVSPWRRCWYFRKVK